MVTTLVISYNLQNVWISEIVSVCWCSKCYSTLFCSPKNLLLATSQESGLFYDPQEPGPSPFQSRATRAANPQFRIREMCMFCDFKKHHGNTTLITIQYQNAIDKLKKQCKVKNDIEFEMKVSVSSDDLPEHEGKYHLQCFNTYMKTANLTKPVQFIGTVLNC